MRIRELKGEIVDLDLKEKQKLRAKLQSGKVVTIQENKEDFKRIPDMLVRFYNIVFRNGYFPKR